VYWLIDSRIVCVVKKTADIQSDWVDWLMATYGLAIGPLATNAGMAHTTLKRKDKDGFKGFSVKIIDTLKKHYNAPGPIEWSLGYGVEDVSPLKTAPEGVMIKPEGDNQSLWVVNTRACSLKGYVPGDYILLERSEAYETGSVVVARVYDMGDRREKNVLRIYRDTYLVPGSTDDRDHDVYSTDPATLTIFGAAVLSMRLPRARG